LFLQLPFGVFENGASITAVSDKGRKPIQRILELQDAPEAHQLGEKGSVGG
jgi:hypothetical protein